MYENQKTDDIDINSPPKPPKFCGVKGCNRKCDIFIKEFNTARCIEHYQREVDQSGQSSLDIIERTRAKLESLDEST